MSSSHEPSNSQTQADNDFLKKLTDEDWVETKTLQVSDETWRPKEGNTVFVQVAYDKFNKYIVENGELVLLEKNV